MINVNNTLFLNGVQEAAVESNIANDSNLIYATFIKQVLLRTGSSYCFKQRFN